MYTTKKAVVACSEEFEIQALILMTQADLRFPTNADEGRELHDQLLNMIINL